MCLRAPVSYDKHNSFPICLYRRVGRKTAWNKPKRLFIPSSQHLAGLNESISLQSLVACHFGCFQTRAWHARSAPPRLETRDFGEAGIALAKASSLSPWNPPFECQRGSQTISSQGEICSGILRLQCLWSHTPTALRKKKRKKKEKALRSSLVQRSFSVIMAHFSVEIAGNSASEKWAAPPFISARCLWCLGYTTAPADLTPGFYRGQGGHTSSISGDHKGLRSLKRGSSPLFRWTDRSRRWRWRLVEGAWQQLLWAEVAPRRGLWITVPQALAKLAQADLWDHHPPPPSTHLVPWTQAGRGPHPPTRPQCLPPLCPVTLRSLVAGQRQRGMHKTHKTEEWENMSPGLSRGVGMFFWNLYPKLRPSFFGFQGFSKEKLPFQFPLLLKNIHIRQIHYVQLLFNWIPLLHLEKKPISNTRAHTTPATCMIQLKITN